MSKSNFIFLAILVIATRILDGITTWLVTPDLKYEQNIVIRHFELDWFQVIILGKVVVVTMIVMLWVGFKNQNRLKIESSNYANYISQFFYNKEWSFYTFVFSFPKLLPSIIFLCLCAPLSLVYYSIFLIINNLFMYFLDYSLNLQIFYARIYYAVDYIYLAMILIVTLVAANKILYRNYMLSKDEKLKPLEVEA
jgi:hypothetical protein